MIEMKISIYMDNDFNIKIINEKNKKSIVIDYTKKELNAFDVYDLLSFTDNNIYSISSNIDDISEGNEKDYFNEIILLINGIIIEVNKLNEKTEDGNNLIDFMELNEDDIGI